METLLGTIMALPVSGAGDPCASLGNGLLSSDAVSLDVGETPGSLLAQTGETTADFAMLLGRLFAELAGVEEPVALFAEAQGASSDLAEGDSATGGEASSTTQPSIDGERRAKANRILAEGVHLVPMEVAWALNADGPLASLQQAVLEAVGQPAGQSGQADLVAGVTGVIEVSPAGGGLEPLPARVGGVPPQVADTLAIQAPSAPVLAVMGQESLPPQDVQVGAFAAVPPAGEGMLDQLAHDDSTWSERLVEVSGQVWGAFSERVDVDERPADLPPASVQSQPDVPGLSEQALEGGPAVLPGTTSFRAMMSGAEAASAEEAVVSVDRTEALPDRPSGPAVLPGTTSFRAMMSGAEAASAEEAVVSVDRAEALPDRPSGSGDVAEPLVKGGDALRFSVSSCRVAAEPATAISVPRTVLARESAEEQGVTEAHVTVDASSEGSTGVQWQRELADSAEGEAPDDQLPEPDLVVGSPSPEPHGIMWETEKAAQVSEAPLAMGGDSGQAAVRMAGVISRLVVLDESRAVVQLHPPEFGRLSIEVTVGEGGVAVAMFVQDYKVKAIVESQLDQLNDALADQGLETAALSVQVGWQSDHRARSWLARRRIMKRPFGAFDAAPVEALPIGQVRTLLASPYSTIEYWI